MVKINEELRNLLFGLSKDSYQLLEESLLEEGCRDPIILWNDIIVDGHNRYEICQKHNIEFLTIQKEFDNIEDVKQWMLINQAGRRNLDPEQLKIIIGKRYNLEKYAHGGDRSKWQNLPLENPHESNVAKLTTLRTETKLAEEYKVSPKTIRNYAKLADEYDKLEVEQPELFEQVKSGEITIQEARNQIAGLDKIPIKDTTSVLATKYTGDDEWYTPLQYIDKARLVMGSIDIDPASNSFAQSRIKAAKYYTIHNNSLDKDWIGNVWLNPPYSRGNIDNFVGKLIEEVRKGNTNQYIVLTNNNTDTQWFSRLATVSGLLCFTYGRINFEKENNLKSSPVNGQVFFYYGENTELFLQLFSDVGLIMEVKK